MESKGPTPTAHRKNAMDGILQALSGLSASDRPHIVIVSGDITWQGRPEGYKEATSWLRTLLDTLELDSSHLVVCAGNHDIQRSETVGMTPPTDGRDADQWIRVESWANFVRPFNNYTAFCAEFPIGILQIGEHVSYLAGVREIEGLNFLVLNSAWFCRDNNDRGKLWIGLPQLQLMASQGQLFRKEDYDKAPLTLAVVHHPKGWLNDGDQGTYNERPAAYSYLAERSHLIFSGHVHTAPEAPSRVNGKAFVIQGGASYVGDQYRNNFGLVKINKEDRSATQIPFEYNPRQEVWNRQQEYPFFFNIGNPPNSAQSVNMNVSLELVSSHGMNILPSEQYWSNLKTILDSPPLTSDVFLINRGEACEKLDEVLSFKKTQLKIETFFTNQVGDFVAAYIASLNEETRVEVGARCFIISNAEAWNAVSMLHEPHFLVANFDLENGEHNGIQLLERALHGGHSVIYGGMPGGIPHPNRATIPNPKVYQLKESLVQAGYNEERARSLAQLSHGNLSSLLRRLKHLSLVPEWAQGTEVDDLAITTLISSWSENNEEDKAIVEKISGIPYGDWIVKIRGISLRPDSPLILKEGNWRSVLRYEGWYALGPRLFDEHLDRFKEIAISVLTQVDPEFDLAPENRFMASIYGKTMRHSTLLRRGISETLALLGSLPEALRSSSTGKADSIARHIVKVVLNNADWVLWASLTGLLPLLAEAAPEEFLEAVEQAIKSSSCPFEKMYAQETQGLTGRSYMSGLLWSLETIAWDARYLTKVVVILGELAQIDPGGKWANRPANSLTTILLPWFPQTAANLQTRKAAVEILLREVPEVAWKLLLTLLPKLHSSSSGTHKPSWRKWIPEDWTSRANKQEYDEQVFEYAGLAMTVAKKEHSNLIDYILRISDLPDVRREELLAFLSSSELIFQSATDRLEVWNTLLQVIQKHQKFSDARWAMDAEIISRLVSIADTLAPEDPVLRYQRLFNDYDSNLYEKLGEYEEQKKLIQERRRLAISEVISIGGIELVLDFARSVSHPRFVGASTGMLNNQEIETKVLPQLIKSGEIAISQFSHAYVWEVFHAKGWEWVDHIDMSTWEPTEIAQFLAYLPFCNETWERVLSLLNDNQVLYWSIINVNPYEASSNLEWAIDRLVEYKRPHLATQCLYVLLHNKGTINCHQAIRTLTALISVSEDFKLLDQNDVVEIITALQKDEKVDIEELAVLEWLLLRLLVNYPGAHPRTLEHKLSNDPSFFYYVITLASPTMIDEQAVDDITEEKRNLATNAYRLLEVWKSPPGLGENCFDGDFLLQWIDEVKKQSSETGHFDVALSIIGEVLVHTPQDPEGLWIHKSAALVLNEKDAASMREGFRSKLLSSRGFYSLSGGKEEQVLAEQYLRQANEIEICGYHRLADTLRQLASYYERDARREAIFDSFDDI